MVQQQRVLVTGGAGFIGSNFVHHFLTQHPDEQVIVLDALTYAGNLQNLAAYADDPRFTFIQGDICDTEIVTKAMRGCKWVINFAAETHVDRSILEAGSFVRTDVVGTYTLLEAARAAGIERFIQISTDEVYGNAEAPNGTSRPSLEIDTLKPLSPYAASKAGADRLAFSYWATYGLPVVITRCSNNYGPYQHPEKQLPLFITNALNDRYLPVYGDGSATRDWIHTSDHCHALDSLLHAPAEMVIGEVFNIGTGDEHSVLDNAQLILDLLGKPRDLIRFVPDRLGHVRRHAVNTQKIKDTLGWKPQISFEQGIAETVSWYYEQQDWLTLVLEHQDTFLTKALVLAGKA
jgi:dTDP-glucose 4,6-dehydratase